MIATPASAERVQKNVSSILRHIVFFLKRPIYPSSPTIPTLYNMFYNCSACLVKEGVTSM